MTKHQSPHVVIVGGGFGGLAVARALRKAPVRITLIDRSNHHLFQPLLYQVATATLAPGDIAAPIRHLLRKQRNVIVAMAEVTGVDVANRRVLVNYLGQPDTPFEYDYEFGRKRCGRTSLARKVRNSSSSLGVSSLRLRESSFRKNRAIKV